MERQGLKFCPYCGGKIEGIKVNNDSSERFDWKGYIFMCPECHATWAFPYASNNEINQWIQR